MATYSRVLLSGSTSGRPIAVAATATPGTLIHAAVAGANAFDEVYLWASNVTASAVALTIEFGGSATSDQAPAALSIPANSENIPILVGQNINGGLNVRAFADTAGAINITGYVNRIA